MKHCRFQWIFLVLLLCSCDNDNKTARTPTSRATDTAESGATVHPDVHLSKTLHALLNPDSVQVLYYTEPDGDTLRYTRFFRYAATADIAFIAALNKSLHQPVSIEDSVRKCRSLGKMYLFKNGEPQKTLYFSSRGDSCSYLYLIDQGRFVYTGLDEALTRSLAQLKQISKTP